MVGGGASSQIGDSHRVACGRDGLFNLTAGAFDIDAKASIAFGKSLGIEPGRAYADHATMLEKELTREDCVEVVSIMTPNSTHFQIAKAFVERGVDVICEKPVTTNMSDALQLYRATRDAGVVFGVMYGYSGYPMVLQAREMVRAGDLGEIHMLKAEFAHGHAITAVEQHKEGAAWRVDPKISGPSFVLADVGTHAYHLAAFISGLQATQVCANLSTLVPGRPLEDNASVWLNYDNGASGSIWASAVATGHQHGLNIRLYGNKGSLEWHQEKPNQLVFRQSARSARIYERGADDLYPAARTERVGIGHPEGYFESFSNVYRLFAQAIRQRRSGREVDVKYPGIIDGLSGVKFIESCLQSAAQKQAWVSTAVNLD